MESYQPSNAWFYVPITFRKGSTHNLTNSFIAKVDRRERKQVNRMNNFDPKVMFYIVWVLEISVCLSTINYNKAKMVKVYYSYSFDQAIGFAASRNANFAVDNHSIFLYIQENWSLQLLVSISSFCLSKQDKSLTFCTVLIIICLSDIFTWHHRESTLLMMKEPLVFGTSKKDNCFLLLNSTLQQYPGFIPAKIKHSSFLGVRMDT